jgi:L-alanine-DL-glutamate epimerase-like enolase superfamily enzyme
MNRDHTMTRADFFKACGALAAGAVGRPRLLEAEPASRAATEPVYLKCWEVVEFPKRREKSREFLKITATNGAVGYCRALGGVKDIRVAEQAAIQANLLDHETLYDLMVSRGVPSSQLKILDIACWDLHARMLGKPLHALLGTKKTRTLRYGDVRGRQPGFSPEKYAKSVASYFERTGLPATKLHFPGAMGTEDSIPFNDVMETLVAVRHAVGDDKILAWDPYPRSAESATPSVDEALQIIRLMDQLGYAWLEGPLPPVPFETQIPKYAELLPGARLRIQAEGPNSPIGDGTSFADMVRWVEAGAVNQCSTDAYITAGLTNALRMMEYAKRHPQKKLVINLHWAWAPHAHLVMAYDDTVCPIAEFPMTEDIPKEYLNGPYLLSPDWPGIYAVE